ncbi:hypothetical protein ACOJBM_16715 [Rhizobium beringeri]
MGTPLSPNFVAGRAAFTSFQASSSGRLDISGGSASASVHSLSRLDAVSQFFSLLR